MDQENLIFCFRVRRTTVVLTLRVRMALITTRRIMSTRKPTH